MRRSLCNVWLAEPQSTQAAQHAWRTCWACAPPAAPPPLPPTQTPLNPSPPLPPPLPGTHRQSPSGCQRQPLPPALPQPLTRLQTQSRHRRRCQRQPRPCSRNNISRVDQSRRQQRGGATLGWAPQARLRRRVPPPLPPPPHCCTSARLQAAPVAPGCRRVLFFCPCALLALRLAGLPRPSACRQLLWAALLAAGLGGVFHIAARLLVGGRLRRAAP